MANSQVIRPVLAIGESIALLRATSSGSFAQVSEIKLSFGGAESNVCIALRRLETPAIWLGRVGDDSFGRRIVRELRAEDVDTRAIVDGSAPTGVMFREQRVPNSSEVTYYRSQSAGSQLSVEDLDLVDVATCGLVHVTGITPALSESAADAVARIVGLASASSVPVSFDVNHRSRLWKDRDFVSTYTDIVSKSAIVFAGSHEARLLVPQAQKDTDLARGLAALGPKQVIIKRGAEGAYALVEKAEYYSPAIAINPVDTIGAGDAFVAGYLAEFMRNKPVEQRLLTAVKAGAFACLNSGDWEGSPRRGELDLLEASDPVIR